MEKAIKILIGIAIVATIITFTFAILISKS